MPYMRKTQQQVSRSSGIILEVSWQFHLATLTLTQAMPTQATGSSLLMACAAGEFQTVETEGLQAKGVHSHCSHSSATGSSSGSEAGQPAGDLACSNSAAGQDKAAPGPVVSAGLAAHLPQARADSLSKASSGDRKRSREQPSRAEHQLLPLLTWADAQRMLDTGRVAGATAALDAMQKEAERAMAQEQADVGVLADS